MNQIIDFVVRHGPPVIFGWVLLDQAGIPLPAVPLLLVIGALAGAGRLSLWLAVAVAMAGCLAADLLWYAFGRRRGASVLGILCRITLEPDSCVRRTEELFITHRLRSLVIAKFLPGLNPLAAALAGVVKIRFIVFVLCEAGGALAWALGWMCLGYLFSGLIEPIAAAAARGHCGGPGRRPARPLRGGEVRPAPALLPRASHGAHHPGEPEGDDGPGHGDHHRGSAHLDSRPGAAVHHSRRAPHQPRGAPTPPARDPSRRRDRPLLHVTNRSDERPGGARVEEARHHPRAPAPGRTRRLARARLPRDADRSGDEGRGLGRLRITPGRR